MNELGLVLDLALKITLIAVAWIVGVGFLVHVIRDPGKQLEKLRKEYEVVIKGKDEQIRDLRERLEYERQKHREEIKQYTKVSKMLKELNAALTEGRVRLKCPKHPDAEVTVLADGTIVCGKGHRLWPPEVVESEG